VSRLPLGDGKELQRTSRDLPLGGNSKAPPWNHPEKCGPGPRIRGGKKAPREYRFPFFQEGGGGGDGSGRGSQKPPLPCESPQPFHGGQRGNPYYIRDNPFKGSPRNKPDHPLPKVRPYGDTPPQTLLPEKASLSFSSERGGKKKSCKGPSHLVSGKTGKTATTGRKRHTRLAPKKVQRKKRMLPKKKHCLGKVRVSRVPARGNHFSLKRYTTGENLKGSDRRHRPKVRRGHLNKRDAFNPRKSPRKKGGLLQVRGKKNDGRGRNLFPSSLNTDGRHTFGGLGRIPPSLQR